MARLPLRFVPDPVLRTKCPPVESFDADLRTLVADMVETVHDAPGVGLAAPQVGIELRVAVVDVSVGEDPEALHVLVNPRILESSEATETDTEGCLSIPGISEKVVRPASVRVAAHDVEGREFELEARGFEARAIFHEIDHLDGILFVDRLRGLRRDRVRRQMRKLIREQEEAVG